MPEGYGLKVLFVIINILISARISKLMCKLELEEVKLFELEVEVKLSKNKK